jgi:hypothetical protein
MKHIFTLLVFWAVCVIVIGLSFGMVIGLAYKTLEWVRAW